ncbi:MULTISPECIES: hypothetical protein [Pseudomonas]|uniref:Uncharacterized protein n=1 Tax=Pseudomonas fluorescens TaxID=294 RepID=A0A166QN62_PSEFL|nr:MULTISPECIES: hypothetical protein [Pseudomonas]KZN20570.1 hypothetical protein A1D17_03260 [Pseudomonas fluorescens]
MNQKFAALALLGGAVCTGYVYAGQQPTVANSYVQNALCGSRQVVEALQPVKLEGWEQTVTIASFTADAIGDKGLVCNVHAVMKREKRNGTTGDIRQVDGLLLVAVTGEGTIVAEKIDRRFADSLLASKAAQAMATN